MKSRNFAIFALLMVQILYGLNYTFAKVVMNENFVQPFALTVLRVGGAVISGALVLTLFGNSDRSGDHVILGNTYIFLNALFYSVYIILIKKLTIKYHPLTFIKWLFLFGFFMVLPFGYSELQDVQWHSFTPYVSYSLLFIVIGATFGTYLLNPIALNKLKASTVGVFIYLQPVIAGLFAVIMGADSIDTLKIIAMILIFSGVYLVSLKSKKI